MHGNNVDWINDIIVNVILRHMNMTMQQKNQNNDTSTVKYETHSRGERIQNEISANIRNEMKREERQREKNMLRIIIRNIPNWNTKWDDDNAMLCENIRNVNETKSHKIFFYMDAIATKPTNQTEKKKLNKICWISSVFSRLQCVTK